MNRALIVGINNYKDKRNKLRGCVNDANALCAVLTSRYQYRDVNMLTDNAATKKNILSNLRSLIEATGKGDTGIFYFSGHGCQIPNADEADRFDECLVTHDHDWGNALSDDDIRDCLSRHRGGAKIALIIDSCHSGDLDDSSDKKVEFHPPEIADALASKRAESVTNVLGRKDSNPKTQRHVLFSACRSDEFALERKVKKQWRGLFTSTFVKHLGVPPKRRKTWGTLYKHVAAVVARNSNFKQNPTLVCNKADRWKQAFTFNNKK